MSGEKSECGVVNIENNILVSLLSNNTKSSKHEIKVKKHPKVKRKKFCFLCRSQTNSLLLILGAYVAIFLIASVILILSVLNLQKLSENDKFNTNRRTSHPIYNSLKYSLLMKSKYDLLPEIFFKEFMWPYKSSLFNCSNLREVKHFNFLKSGWTKNVFSFEHGGNYYALKTVNTEGIDMTKCKQKEKSKACFDKASSKLYKEYILSKELSHSNIVKVLAWCVNNFTNSVAIVTELCSPLDLVMLLRMSFQQRLKIMLDLSQLMAYLAESPLGSIAINDFQRQQFIMCGDTLKLTDLDDLSTEEPKCTDHEHCLQKKFISNLQLDDNHTDKHFVKCTNNICSGYNEKQNVINTFKHFVNMFLNITTPVGLKQDVEALFNSYTNIWSAKTILKQTEILYIRYNYLKNEIYKKN